MKMLKGHPVLRATKINDDQVRVHCPYCGRRHLHGLPDSTEPTHRIAECLNGNSYFIQLEPTEYEAAMEEAKQEVLRGST